MKRPPTPEEHAGRLEANLPAVPCYWCRGTRFWQCTTPGLEDQVFCAKCWPDMAAYPNGRTVESKSATLGGRPESTLEDFGIREAEAAWQAARLAGEAAGQEGEAEPLSRESVDLLSRPRKRK